MTSQSKIYIANAFTKGAFTGNPAAYIPLQEWPSDKVLQALAQQNNLSETAFTVPHDQEDFEIRWFTPTTEVTLCGHATLACAFIQFEILHIDSTVISFASRSGRLTVTMKDHLYELNFPSDQIALNENIMIEYGSIFGTTPAEVYKGRDDLLLIYDSPQVIREMRPDFNAMHKIKMRGVIVSAADDGDYDFVSRAFYPQSGIDEDPATGSAHTTLTPYWSQRLGKSYLRGHQCSARGGYFSCHHLGDRTLISGSCDLYLTGAIRY